MSKNTRQVIFTLALAFSVGPAIFAGFLAMALFSIPQDSWVVFVAFFATYALVAGAIAINLKPWKD